MEGGQAQMDACGQGKGGKAPCERPHRKLESTNVILSSSHAKKLASFYQNFVFGRNKKWEFFRRYKLVIKIINSTVLNKLQSYSRILALGPKCHCTSRFKRAMCISCRPHVDVHKGERVSLMWTQVDMGRGQKSDFLWTS